MVSFPVSRDRCGFLPQRKPELPWNLYLFIKSIIVVCLFYGMKQYFVEFKALSSPYLAMKSGTRLDSLVFQLTPTRTRFVRFVSTPEILERVCTIGSEMSQILEAIAFQNKYGVELHRVQDHQIHKESSEAASRKQYTHASKSGNTAITSNNEEKAIVVYKPYGLESDQSNILGDTSKGIFVYLIGTQLLRVLETRKRDLQKEQGMAFAQAVAAGFDIDHIASLMSIAECFGATRIHAYFMDLWKAKHESGQWVEIEPVEAMDNLSI